MCLYVIDDHPLMSDAMGIMLRRLYPDGQIVKLARLSALASACLLYTSPSPRDS